LTRDQTAELLSCTPDFVSKLVKDRGFPAPAVIGRRHLFDTQAVLEYLDRQAKQ
jgi:excisionase family DNA binding protein